MSEQTKCISIKLDQMNGYGCHDRHQQAIVCAASDC